MAYIFQGLWVNSVILCNMETTKYIDPGLKNCFAKILSHVSLIVASLLAC